MFRVDEARWLILVLENWSGGGTHWWVLRNHSDWHNMNWLDLNGWLDVGLHSHSWSASSLATPSTARSTFLLPFTASSPLLFTCDLFESAYSSELLLLEDSVNKHNNTEANEWNGHAALSVMS